MGIAGAKGSALRRVGEWIAALPLLLLAAAILLALSPIIVPVLVYTWLKGRLLDRRFRREFAAKGVPAIVVYSNSPNWQGFFETEILPRIGPHAVVLNWSERSTWRGRRSLPIRVYQHHKPGRDYNPYTLIFHPKGAPVSFGFFEAFRDNRHGKPHELGRAVQRLFAEVDAAVSAWGHSAD